MLRHLRRNLGLSEAIVDMCNNLGLLVDDNIRVENLKKRMNGNLFDSASIRIHSLTE